MTFSPDDFDTSGPELAPMEGEEPTNPLDGYTAEEQAAAAALYSVVEKPVTEVAAEAEPAVVESGADVVSTESEPAANLEELTGLRESFTDEQEALKGELEVAVASGDTEAVLTVYKKLLESKINASENESKILTTDFEGGDFQRRISQPEGLLSGKELQDKVSGIYESQLATRDKSTAELKESLAKLNQSELPASFVADVIYQEGLSTKAEGDVSQVLFEMMNKADEVAGWEKNSPGSSYGNYTKKLEGALGTAVAQNMARPNPNLVQAMKSASRKFGNKLPANLVQQIDSL